MKPAEFYDTDYFHLMERRYYFHAHGERIRDISSFIPSKQKILDYGAGSGFFAETARAKGNEVTSIDFSPAARKFIRNHYPEVHVIDEEGEISETFDCIMALDVIEHLDYPSQGPWIEKLKNWLAPEGILILSTDNLDSPFSHSKLWKRFQNLDMKVSHEGRFYRMMKNAEARIPYKKSYGDSHVGLLGRDQIVKLLSDHGFILKKEKHGFLFSSPISTVASKIFKLTPLHSVYQFVKK